MKYYLIAGEASGDLHASHLMAALREEDKEAEFRYFGGDLMAQQGGTLVQHYKELAYMGIMPVLMHLPTILRGMKNCQQDILQWQPDVVILVDYPGFNLKIARFLRKNTHIPVFYFISPKIWAWKEHRIKDIKRDVDELFSILPFEVEFFEGKHHYPIHYVGNPTMDEVDAYLRQHPADAEAFRRENALDSRPIIALLAGSRKQEIKDNLGMMMEAAKTYSDQYQLVLAAAPGIDDSFYSKWTGGDAQTANGNGLKVVREQTYRLLQHSTAALVTSGTATLETALFRIPQVVCYYTPIGHVISLVRKLVLKIPYISLVNLVADKEVVPELVAHLMTVENVRHHLGSILPGGSARQTQLDGYEFTAKRLGAPGAPAQAAREMTAILRKKKQAAK